MTGVRGAGSGVKPAEPGPAGVAPGSAPPATPVCANEITRIDPPSVCDLCGAQIHRALVDRNLAECSLEVLEKNSAGAFIPHQCAPESARPDCR